MSDAIEVLKTEISLAKREVIELEAVVPNGARIIIARERLDAFHKALLALENQENKVCIPINEVRDLFVEREKSETFLLHKNKFLSEMENYLDFSEGHCKRLRKKVGELKQQVHVHVGKSKRFPDTRKTKGFARDRMG